MRGVAGVCVIALALAAAGAGRGSSACAWQRVQAPSMHGSLVSVSTRSPWDVWALGSGVAAHWDGVRWHTHRTGRADTLRDVYVAPDAEAWAVGERRSDAAIERWDGARWSSVPLGALERAAVRGTGATRTLDAVAGRSATDVWATGYDWQSSASVDRVRGVLLHWAGAAWRSVPVPRGLDGTFLDDVTETRAGDVWVVGEGSGDNDGIAARYARGRWRVFHLRGPSGVEGVAVQAVADLGDGEIAAVGSAGTTPGHLTGEAWGLSFRFDGRRWHTHVPDYNESFASYDAVAERSPAEVWIADNDANPYEQPHGAQLFTAERPHARTKLDRGWIVDSLAFDGRSLWAVGGIGSAYAHRDIDYSYARFRPLVLRRGC